MSSNSKSNKQSRTNRLLKALTSGDSLTASQITSRFKLAVPRAQIFQLREDGHNIVSKPLKNSRRAPRIVTGKQIGRAHV